MLIDLEEFPSNDPDHLTRAPAITGARAQLAEVGCAVLQGFLTRQGIQALRTEADNVAYLGHHSHSRINVYFTQDDPSLPQDHPVRRFFGRSNAFVPAETLPQRARCDRFRSIQGLTNLFSFASAKRTFIVTTTRWQM